MEKLKYLLANPYTWLFIAFIFALPYIFKYIRQFFPKKLQEQMAKEEVCNLEAMQKPEMKRIRKNMTMGIVISFLTSTIVSYFSEESLAIFRMIFASMLGLVALYSVIAEYKVNKGENCLKIYDKRELIMQIGIYGGLVVLFFWLITSGIGKIK